MGGHDSTAAVCWDGQPTLPAEAFEGVAQSLEIRGEPLLMRPTAADYTRCLRAGGQLPEGEELAEHPLLVAQAQAHWHASEFNGCVFSARLSAHRTAHGWQTFVIRDRGAAHLNAETIEEATRPTLAVTEVEIVSVIAPFVVSGKQLAELLVALGALPGWTLEELATERDGRLGSLVRLALRTPVRPPLSEDPAFDHQSEVLGFGPQPTGARTRRAPFTEIAVRAKAPARARPSRRAYMADVTVVDERGVKVDGSQMAEMGAQTKELRRSILDPDQDQRGKAKVTFTVDEEEWRAATA